MMTFIKSTIEKVLVLPVLSSGREPDSQPVVALDLSKGNHP